MYRKAMKRNPIRKSSTKPTNMTGSIQHEDSSTYFESQLPQSEKDLSQLLRHSVAFPNGEQQLTHWGFMNKNKDWRTSDAVINGCTNGRAG